MSLDLGALVAHVVVDTATAERNIARIQRQLAQLATSAEKSSGGVRQLDTSLTATAASADKAGAAMTRSQRSTTQQAAASQKAAAAAKTQADAETKVSAVMNRVTVDAQRMQQAELRVIAARERLDAVTASGTATTRSLASAQAGLIGAERSLQRAQEQSAGRMSTLTGSMDTQAAAMERLERLMAGYAGASSEVRAAVLREAAAQERANVAAGQGSAQFARLASSQAALMGATRGLARAQEESTVAGGRMRSGLSGLGRTAAELGLLFGAIEGVKKAIEITKEANTFNASMTRIETVVGASKAEINGMSAALLKMAGPVAQAPDELSKSLYHMEAIGLRGAKALDAVRVAAMGAKIGNADLEETTNALTSTVASGITKGQSFKTTMAQLLTIVGTGDMKLSDFNDALSSGLLTIMSTYGVSLRDVGAALATFGDNNIRGANAATMLRIAVQSLASPGVGKRSQDALDRLGVSASDLKGALQHGGLNEALTLLRDRMAASGVGAKEAGALITDAFTKRGAQGINVLLKQFDRVQSKYHELDSNSANFGKRWQQTTRTAAFALSSLGHEIEAAGITIMGKLGPATASAATWLATSVPHALSVLGNALGPTIHLVGVGLVGAWRGLIATLGPVASLLGSIGHFLAEHKALTTGVVTGVLAMWGAWKGYQVARAALSAISGLLARVAPAAVNAATGIRGMSAASIAGGAAMAGLGIVVTAAVMSWQRHQQQVAANKAAIEGYTQAVEEDSGAVGKNTRAMVEDNLVKQDAYKYATQLGVSQKTVTDAVLGSASAMKAVNAALNAHKNGSDRDQVAALGLAAAVGQGNTQVKAAVQNAKDKAAADGKSTDAIGKNTAATAAHTAATQKDNGVLQFNINSHGQLVQSMVKAGSQVDNTSAALDRERLASNLLKNSLDALNGVAESVESTSDSFAIALGNLRNKSALFKNANGDVITSLDKSTVAGATNRQMIVSLIDAAKAHAQAVADQARRNGSDLPEALAKGNAALKNDEDAIRAAASAAHLSKDQTDRLLGSLGKLARIKLPPKKLVLSDDEAFARLTRFQRQMGLLHDKTVTIRTVMSSSGGGGLGNSGSKTKNTAQAVGTQAAFGRSTIPPNTTFTVGEKGWEGGVSDSQGRVSIFSNAQSKAMGFQAPVGYANGTVGAAPGITTGTVSGKQVWYVDGHAYSSFVAAQNKINSLSKQERQQAISQARQTAVTSASGAITNIGTDKYSFTFAAFVRQVHAASVALQAAIKAGASPSQIRSLTIRLDRDKARGEKIERRLGKHIGYEGTVLGTNLAKTVSINGKGVAIGSVMSTADARAGLLGLESDAHKAGLSSAQVKHLLGENKAILNAVHLRNVAATMLLKANQKVLAAQKVLHDDKVAFSGAVTGTFDVTSAGTDDNGRVSGKRMLAQERQAVTRARQWVTGLRKLIGLKAFPASYIRELAGKGPDALGQLQAILGMPKADLKAFETAQSQLVSYGSQAGTLAANRLDKPAVDRAKADQKAWAKRERTRQHHLENLMSTFRHDLVTDINGLHFKFDFSKTDLALVVRQGQNELKNKRGS